MGTEACSAASTACFTAAVSPAAIPARILINVGSGSVTAAEGEKITPGADARTVCSLSAGKLDVVFAACASIPMLGRSASSKPKGIASLLKGFEANGSWAMGGIPVGFELTSAIIAGSVLEGVGEASSSDMARAICSSGAGSSGTAPMAACISTSLLSTAGSRGRPDAASKGDACALGMAAMLLVAACGCAPAPCLAAAAIL
mmetsp:Transcript_73941/g.140669  ORF Transcript_73941/g.140669 Transcript_73941/m.140669 type:complete len:202 (+) Transcript_73941:662-1267(+)